VFFFLFIVHVRAILQANIPLYIYYGYQKSYNWTNAFKTQNNIWEIEEIQYYLLEHAVTGFILKNLFEVILLNLFIMADICHNFVTFIYYIYNLS